LDMRKIINLEPHFDSIKMRKALVQPIHSMAERGKSNRPVKCLIAGGDALRAHLTGLMDLQKCNHRMKGKI
jgi:hypothetical protein